MTHDDFRAALDAYVDRSLSPERSAAMTDHLRACPSCAQHWDEAFRLRAALQEADELELLSPPAQPGRPQLASVSDSRRPGRAWLSALRPQLQGAAVMAPLAMAAGVLLALQLGRVTTPGGGVPGLLPGRAHEPVALPARGKTRGGDEAEAPVTYVARIGIPVSASGEPAMDPTRVVSIEGLRAYFTAHPDNQLVVQGPLPPAFREALAAAHLPMVERAGGQGDAVELVVEPRGR